MFVVELNVNLYATATILISAADEVAAKQLAHESLEQAIFSVVAENVANSQIFPSLLQENVETEILQVYETDDSFAADSDALRTQIEMHLGRRLREAFGRFRSRELTRQWSNIESEFIELLNTELFDDLWQLYLGLVPKEIRKSGAAGPAVPWTSVNPQSPKH
jgi:hypothetical protein